MTIEEEEEKKKSSSTSSLRRFIFADNDDDLRETTVTDASTPERSDQSEEEANSHSSFDDSSSEKKDMPRFSFPSGMKSNTTVSSQMLWVDTCEYDDVSLSEQRSATSDYDETNSNDRAISNYDDDDDDDKEEASFSGLRQETVQNFVSLMKPRRLFSQPRLVFFSKMYGSGSSRVAETAMRPFDEPSDEEANSMMRKSVRKQRKSSPIDLDTNDEWRPKKYAIATPITLMDYSTTTDGSSVFPCDESDVKISEKCNRFSRKKKAGYCLGLAVGILIFILIIVFGLRSDNGNSDSSLKAELPDSSIPTISPVISQPSVTVPDIPRDGPTLKPTTNAPTSMPTNHPTAKPTREPSNPPTAKPTPEPTPEPTREPSKAPTRTPTRTPSYAQSKSSRVAQYLCEHETVCSNCLQCYQILQSRIPSLLRHLDSHCTRCHQE